MVSQDFVLVREERRKRKEEENANRVRRERGREARERTLDGRCPRCPPESEKPTTAKGTRSIQKLMEDGDRRARAFTCLYIAEKKANTATKNVDGPYGMIRTDAKYF